MKWLFAFLRGSCKTQETTSGARRDWLSAGKAVRALCPPPIVKLLARATPKGLEGVKCEAAASQRFLGFCNYLLIPFLAFSSPQEELLKIFDIPTNASQSEIVAEAQRLWMQQGKERWQFETRYENLRPQLWPLFDQMGMLEQVKPVHDHYETVLVFGALFNRVQDRVDYLIKTGVTYDKIVFLTGQRPLLDSEKSKLPGLETETDMVRWVYEHSPLPKTVSVIWIDVPMKGTQRPNTLDTINAWLSTNPLPCSCLAISNQPYVHYQDAVLNRHVPFPIETAGPSVLGNPSVALMLDTLAREWTYKYGDLTWLQQ